MTKPLKITTFELKFPISIKNINHNKILRQLALYAHNNNNSITTINKNIITLTDNSDNTITSINLNKLYATITTNKLTHITPITTIIFINQQ